MTLDRKHDINGTFRQLILLDREMKFVGSDDYIFSTEKLKKVSVKKWFPFIESIFDALNQLRLGEKETQFLRVESPAEFLPGSYDFSFEKIKLDGEEYVRWSIYDYTQVYTYLTKYQQLKNEKDIYRQKLEYKNGQISSLKELFK